MKPKREPDKVKLTCAKVVELALEGDSEAWEILYTVHSPQLRKDLKYSLLKNLSKRVSVPKDVDNIINDLVQKTFAKAFEIKYKFSYEGREKGYRWLKQIGLYEVSAWCRKYVKKLNILSLDELSDNEDGHTLDVLEYAQLEHEEFDADLMLREQLASVDDAMETLRLNTTHREIYLFYYLRDYSVSELATMYSYSETTIRQITSRVNSKLKGYFNEDENNL